VQLMISAFMSSGYPNRRGSTFAGLGYHRPMAIIRTTDKREFEVEVSAKKADEEIVRVGGRAIPIVDLKLAGKDEMVFINATHIVSIENGE
jgi:hypothetical protein